MGVRLVSLLLVALVALPARAEDERTRRAREEVERELEELVKVPPPQATVSWTGLDKPGFELDEARFELDDERLSYGELEALKPGTVLYQGRIGEGPHRLKVSLSLHKTNVSLFEGLRTTKYKVSSDIPFPGAKGLAIGVRVGLRIDTQQSEPKKQLALAVQVKPEMLAKVDDAPPPMPPAPPPVVRVEAEPAAAQPAAPPLPQPPMVRPEEPPPVAAAEPEHHHRGPKGKAHAQSAVEALKQKILHPAAPVLVAQAESVDAGPPAPAEPPDAGPPDAGSPDAGQPDAGPPPAPIPAPAVAQAPAPAPEEPGLPWVPIALGVAALAVVAVLALRRRK